MGSTPSPHSSLLPRHNFIPSFFTSFPSVAQGDMEWVVWSVQHILSLPLLPPQRKDSSQSSSMVPPTGHNPLWNFPSLCLGIFSGHAHRAWAQGTLRYVRELWKWRHLYVCKQALTISPEEQLQGQPWVLFTVMRWLLVHLWLPAKALLSLLIGVAGCMCICALFMYLHLYGIYLALCCHTHVGAGANRQERRPPNSTSFNN